jgi:hypothetical protein
MAEMQVLQEQKPACFALFWAVYLIFTGFFDKRLRRASMPAWSLARHPASRCLQSWRKYQRP